MRYEEFDKRALVSDDGGGGGEGVWTVAQQSLGSGGMFVLTVVGVAAMAGLAMASVMFAMRRRRQAQYQVHDERALKQFTLPKNVKPVISFKNVAGPGGLKKSPSPCQSPETSDEWSVHAKVQQQQQAAAGSSQSHTPSLQMSPVDDDKATASASATEASPGGDGDETVTVTRGALSFTLRYSFDKNALQVTIGRAAGLPELPSSAGESTVMDPYVKLQLLPEKQHKVGAADVTTVLEKPTSNVVKTRVVRNTLDPVYDEEFTFYGISYNQLQSTTLHFAVVAFDRYSRDEIVGEVICPLHQIDLSDSERTVPLTMDLTSRTSKFENTQNRGELLVSLCYQPGTNKITAVVLKAKNLPKFDITGLADPYVKVYMLYNGQKMAKKKTHVKKRTLAPVYNESFVFDLPSGDPAVLEQISFEFLVMDWDRVTKNEVMGRCAIGASSRSHSAKSHWDQVRRNARRQIAEWHRLRP